MNLFLDLGLIRPQSPINFSLSFKLRITQLKRVNPNVDKYVNLERQTKGRLITQWARSCCLV
jgi:hypothetical protein